VIKDIEMALKFIYTRKFRCKFSATATNGGGCRTVEACIFFLKNLIILEKV